jgi:hypothetical protein
VPPNQHVHTCSRGFSSCASVATAFTQETVELRAVDEHRNCNPITTPIDEHPPITSLQTRVDEGYAQFRLDRMQGTQVRSARF